MPAKKKVAPKKSAVKKKSVKKKAIKMPKTLGGLADAIYQQQQVIKEINREFNLKLDTAKKDLMALEEHAFTTFKNQDMEGAKGKIGQLSISRQVVPQMESSDGWPALFKWIVKTKDFSVLQKRLATTHIKDLWEDGVKLPSVIPFTKVSLTSTKVKAKK